MLISAIFSEYSRDELEQKIMAQSGEILALEKLLLTCGEELHKLGTDNMDLLATIKDNHMRRWDYPKGYDIGTFNQMRMYIAELESLIGKDKALEIRSNKCKYLSYWFDMTEPKK